MERGGPEAVAFYSGNPSAFHGVNPAINVAFMDALGSHNRYNVGGVDHNAHFFVNERMYGQAFFTLVPDRLSGRRTAADHARGA